MNIENVDLLTIGLIAGILLIILAVVIVLVNAAKKAPIMDDEGNILDEEVTLSGNSQMSGDCLKNELYF